MRRTKYFKGSLFILAGIVLMLAFPQADARSAKKPNVVLMLADNVGYGDIGAFQGGAIRGMPTPRIDRLASEGLILTQFITEPGCTPSRAGLNTGRYAHRSGLGSIIVKGTPSTLLDEEITMAELFKSAGYATAMTGKWHLGADEQSLPVNQGFDEYKVGVLETSDSTLYRPNMKQAGFPEAAIAAAAPKIWEGNAKDGLKPVREYTVEYRKQVEADIAKASIGFIEKLAKKRKPFFLYVGFTNTHYPSVTAPEFQYRSPAGPYGYAIIELVNRTG
jgi:arylsulfatase A-like enzyme